MSFFLRDLEIRGIGKLLQPESVERRRVPEGHDRSTPCAIWVCGGERNRVVFEHARGAVSLPRPRRASALSSLNFGIVRMADFSRPLLQHGGLDEEIQAALSQNSVWTRH